MKNWLTNDVRDCLDKKSPLPLKDILTDSLFYPAAGYDGSPVRHAKSLGVNSFVYVDSSMSEQTLDFTLLVRPFRGYRVFGQRELVKTDLIPDGWIPSLPENFDLYMKQKYIDAMRAEDANPQNAFARWIVLKRNDRVDDTHGPESFSLLYIRGEGVATYQAMYAKQGVVPKILAIIRPGTIRGGGNYSYFENFLLEVVLMHPQGMPPHLLEWHGADGSSRNPDSPWVKHYPTKSQGPMPKDEPGFFLSLYDSKV